MSLCGLALIDSLVKHASRRERCHLGLVSLEDILEIQGQLFGNLKEELSHLVVFSDTRNVVYVFHIVIWSMRGDLAG